MLSSFHAHFQSMYPIVPTTKWWVVVDVEVSPSKPRFGTSSLLQTWMCWKDFSTTNFFEGTSLRSFCFFLWNMNQSALQIISENWRTKYELVLWLFLLFLLFYDSNFTLVITINNKCWHYKPKFSMWNSNSNWKIVKKKHLKFCIFSFVKNWKVIESCEYVFEREWYLNICVESIKWKV